MPILMQMIYKLLTLLFLALTSVSLAYKLPSRQKENLRLQIFLDQNDFGPGILDGKVGSYTTKALYAYNQTKGRSPKNWTATRKEAAKVIKQVLIVTLVPPNVDKFVDTEFPVDELEEQSKHPSMPYRSIIEMMAERYHTTEDFLKQVNGWNVTSKLKAGSKLMVPNISPFRIENIYNVRTQSTNKGKDKRWLLVDTKNNQLRVLQSSKALPKLSIDHVEKQPDVKLWNEGSSKVLATFPITPGQSKFIRRGVWKMLNSTGFPTWRYDKSLLKEGTYSKEYLMLPAGPNNPVGIYWMGLSRKGIGIHGTNKPRRIGRSRSSGCVRMANWDVVRIPQYIASGCTVVIK